MRPALSSFVCVLALTACGSPPPLPQVDASDRRPVNSPLAVELQVCKTDLHNRRLLDQEAGAVEAKRPPHLEATTALANTVFTLHFEFGSTRVDVPPQIAASLIEQAKAAPLVLLRGRTDGAVDSLVDSRIARERALAVHDYLVAAGVDPARIRSTYQPVGDGMTDNASASGRNANRRVEIEVYRTLPVAVSSPN